jgi:signal transduction histidine kinase
MAEPDTCTRYNILHLEDSVPDHQLASRALARAGVNASLVRVDSLDAFGAALQDNPDLILADYRLAGFTALDAWDLLRRQGVRKPFVLLSGAIGESAAVQAIQRGMSDYLAKEDVARLGTVLLRALATHQTLMAREHADAELAASEKRLAEFTVHLQSAIEQERAAIARDIHDDIGGSLAAVRFDLAWMARHCIDAGVKAHVQSASDMLQQAMAASQSIMMNLRPPVLDQGLAAALEWLCGGFEKRTRIRTVLNARVSASGHGRDLELTAYRTAQEALTNVLKYARARQVRVDVSDGQGVLTLEISDDGCGIAPADLDKPRSFGLKGLRERARTVGGWLDISANPGAGTSITLSVPLALAQDDASLKDFQ